MIDYTLAELSRTRCLVCADGNLTRMEATLTTVSPIPLNHLTKLAVICRPRISSEGEMVVRPRSATVVSWRVGPSQDKLPKSADDERGVFTKKSTLHAGD